MGSHGSGEEFEARLEDSGLWWKDRRLVREARTETRFDRSARHDDSPAPNWLKRVTQYNRA